jgi:polysaccharide transporter, PST family
MNLLQEQCDDELDCCSSPQPTPFPAEDGTLASDGLRANSLLGGVVILLVLTVAQRLVGFVRAILFCRWLGPEELGQWDMAWGFLMLAGPLAVLSLPGTFGRYVEHFRQRGQLRTFLLRTAAFCLVLGGSAVALIYSFPQYVAKLIFDNAEQTSLVTLLAASLLAVIAYNYLTCLFTALRCIWLVCCLELANSISFAALGIGLLLVADCNAGSVVIAFGGACLLCVLGALWWVRRVWLSAPDKFQPASHRSFWWKLMPFTAWLMIGNLLTNLFQVADRYILVHFAPGDSTDGLALVGQYHSSRVVPLLLASVATMLGTMLLPHLSRDWEAGRREHVSQRMNLFLKLLALGLMAASAAVLIVAPLLFQAGFQGQYAKGQGVLPWVLVYCVWFGVATVAQTYLWCAERANWATAALLVGFAISVALNIVLVPSLGLTGAALGTTAANLAVLVITLWLSHRFGLRNDRGLWVILAAPPALCLGPGVAALVIIFLFWLGIRTDLICSPEEKRQIVDRATDILEKLRSMRPYLN